MIERNSIIYKNIVSLLGIQEDLPLSIPIRYAQTDPDGLEFSTVSMRIKAAQRTLNVSKKDKIKILNNMINAVHFSDAKEKHFFEKNDSKYVRAFFVVSRGRLNRNYISFKLAGVKIIRWYGGRCEQRITHYHYVFVTNFDICVNLMKYGIVDINRADFNITNVGLSSVNCINYISGQTAYRALIEDWKLPGYTDNHYEWYAPRKNTKSTINIDATNYIWHNSSYTLKNIENNNTEPIDATNMIAFPDDSGFRQTDIYECEYVMLSHDIEGIINKGRRYIYRGQPIVIVYKRREDINNVKLIAKRKYKNAVKIYIK